MVGDQIKNLLEAVVLIVTVTFLHDIHKYIQQLPGCLLIGRPRAIHQVIGETFRSLERKK